MSGPGDKDWEARRRRIHGEAEEGAEESSGTSTAETGSSPSFTGDGPSGESISGGVQIGTDADSGDKDDKKK